MKTLDQYITERLHVHYGKHYTPHCHKLNVVFDIAQGYAEYKTQHQRNIIRKQSEKIKQLEQKIRDYQNFTSSYNEDREGMP